MAYTQDQLSTLSKINEWFKTKYGANAQQEFQNYVTKNYWADKLEEIKTNLAQSTAQQPAQQPTIQPAPSQIPEQVVNTPNVTPKVETPKLTIQTWPWTTVNETPAPETMETTVTKQETPTWTVTTTEKPKEVKPLEKITTIDQFKQKWANVNNLEQFIEDRYWTTAQIQWDWVVANINGENFKWTIDSAWNPIKTSLGKGEMVTPAKLTSQDYLTQLIQWQKIQTNNPDAIEAQHIYDNIKPYIWAWVDSLYSSMVSGKIVPWSDVYNDMIKASWWVESPAMIEAKAKYQQKIKTDLINKNVDIQAWEYKEPVNPVQVASDNLVKTKWMDYAMEFKNDILENPEINNLVTDLNDTNAQIKELEYAKRQTLDQIIKDHPWISMWMAIWIAQNQNGDIDDQLFWLYNKQATQQANLDYKTNLASKMFDYKIKQNEQDIADAQKELEYQRELAAATEQRQYETQQALEERQYNAQQQAQETKQAFENQKELLALQNQYKDADIQTSIITDEATGKKALINNETWEVIKEYDTWLAPTKETSQNYWFANIWDWTIAVTNPTTWQVEFKKANWEATSWTPLDLLTAPDWTLIKGKYWVSETMSQPWMQCGEYVNKITWIWVWDTLQSKLSKMTNKATNSYEPVKWEVWDVAVWVPDPSSKLFSKYWHTWIIVWEEWNNWLIKSSNIHWDWAITTDVIPKQAIMWTTWNYDKNKLVQQPENTWELSNLWQYMKDNQDRWTGYSNDDVKAFNEKIDRFVKNWDENWMIVSYRNMIMKDKDFKTEFDNTKKFISWLDQAQKLINDYNSAGKSTNALKAMAEKVGRSLWITTDKALAQLQTQMGFTLANYIKSISGTAASDAEVQRLMGNMANIWNVKELNDTIIWQVKDNSLSSLKSMIDTRMYWMPEELKPKVFSDIYQNTTIQPKNTQNGKTTDKLDSLVNSYFN